MRLGRTATRKCELCARACIAARQKYRKAQRKQQKYLIWDDHKGLMSVSIVGDTATVAEALRRFSAATEADELIAVSHIYDHAARVRSLEILASAGSAIG